MWLNDYFIQSSGASFEGLKFWKIKMEMSIVFTFTGTNRKNRILALVYQCEIKTANVTRDVHWRFDMKLKCYAKSKIIFFTLTKFSFLMYSNDVHMTLNNNKKMKSERTMGKNSNHQRVTCQSTEAIFKYRPEKKGIENLDAFLPNTISNFFFVLLL